MNDIKLYRPTSGTEGLAFEYAWCENCKHYDDCEIPTLAQCFEIDEDEYPQQWRYDGLRPVCTEFEKESFWMRQKSDGTLVFNAPSADPDSREPHESQLGLFG